MPLSEAPALFFSPNRYFSDTTAHIPGPYIVRGKYASSVSSIDTHRPHICGNTTFSLKFHWHVWNYTFLPVQISGRFPYLPDAPLPRLSAPAALQIFPCSPCIPPYSSSTVLRQSEVHRYPVLPLRTQPFPKALHSKIHFSIYIFPGNSTYSPEAPSFPLLLIPSKTAAIPSH